MNLDVRPILVIQPSIFGSQGAVRPLSQLSLVRLADKRMSASERGSPYSCHSRCVASRPQCAAQWNWADGCFLPKPAASPQAGQIVSSLSPARRSTSCACEAGLAKRTRRTRRPGNRTATLHSQRDSQSVFEDVFEIRCLRFRFRRQ